MSTTLRWTLRSVSIKLVQVISTTIDLQGHLQKATLLDMKVADFSGMVTRTRAKESVYSVYAPTQKSTASNNLSESQRIHDALAHGTRNTVQMKIPTVSDLRCFELRIAHGSLISYASSLDCQRNLCRKDSECKPLCQDQTCHTSFVERAVSKNPDQHSWLNVRGGYSFHSVQCFFSTPTSTFPFQYN